ncbi:hypothetical protein DFH27DRAFT_609657 [Peziza echinospora]|nr:hypothetical protein DFH27DRAFT_609657 [Peziza echinospora]
MPSSSPLNPKAQEFALKAAKEDSQPQVDQNPSPKTIPISPPAHLVKGHPIFPSALPLPSTINYSPSKDLPAEKQEAIKKVWDIDEHEIVHRDKEFRARRGAISLPKETRETLLRQLSASESNVEKDKGKVITISTFWPQQPSSSIPSFSMIFLLPFRTPRTWNKGIIYPSKPPATYQNGNLHSVSAMTKHTAATGLRLAHTIQAMIWKANGTTAQLFESPTILLYDSIPHNAYSAGKERAMRGILGNLPEEIISFAPFLLSAPVSAASAKILAIATPRHIPPASVTSITPQSHAVILAPVVPTVPAHRLGVDFTSSQRVIPLQHLANSSYPSLSPNFRLYVSPLSLLLI